MMGARMKPPFARDLQYAKFAAYGFLKNLQFAEPFLVLFLLSRGQNYLQIGSLYATGEAAGGAVGVGLAVVAGTAILAFPLYHLRTRV